MASSYIPLPRCISAKKAVINVKNTDQRCFAYAIMSKILYDQGAQHLQRVVKYTMEIWNLFNFDDVRFPTPFADIKIFERKNEASVNVYGLEKDFEDKLYGYPIRISGNVKINKHFDLL